MGAVELSVEERKALGEGFMACDDTIQGQAYDALRGVLSKAEACLSEHFLVMSARRKRHPYALVIGGNQVRAGRDWAQQGYGFFHLVDRSKQSRYRDALFRPVRLGDGDSAIRALFVSTNLMVCSRSHGVTVVPVHLMASCLHGAALLDAYVTLKGERGEESSVQPAKLPLRQVAVDALDTIPLRSVHFTP